MVKNKTKKKLLAVAVLVVILGGLSAAIIATVGWAAFLVMIGIVVVMGGILISLMWALATLTGLAD